jgi:hypothetical protein
MVGDKGALDDQIAERTRYLKDVETRLISAATPVMQVDRELHVRVFLRPLNQWLTEVTVPQYVLEAVGTSAGGDLIYKPGFGKAWIEPAHDSWVKVFLQRASIASAPNTLSWSATIRAQAETRIRIHVLGSGGNILCKGDIPTKRASGRIEVGKPTEMRFPYTMTILEPASLAVQVNCGLGGLGTATFTIPVDNFAHKPSEGHWDVGFKEEGYIEIPKEAGGGKIPYKVESKDEVLEIDTKSFRAGMNADIKLGERK